MSFVLLSLLPAAAALAACGWLAVAGPRDGDESGDVTIRASGWDARLPGVQLELVNPGGSVALVWLAPARRRGTIAGGPDRGRGRRRATRRLARGGLAAGELVAVGPGEQASVDVRLPPRRRRMAVDALVGTPGRLRRHDLIVQTPVWSGGLRPANGLRVAELDADLRVTPGSSIGSPPTPTSASSTATTYSPPTAPAGAPTSPGCRAAHRRSADANARPPAHRHRSPGQQAPTQHPESPNAGGKQPICPIQQSH